MAKTRKKLVVVLSLAVVLGLAGYFIFMPASKDVMLIIACAKRAKIDSSLDVAVVLKNSDTSKVSALEFVLKYDNTIFTGPKIKETAVLREAQKEASFEISAQEGALKVVIFGLNQNSIKDGKVLEASFKIKPEARPAKALLMLDRAVAATPEAQAIEIKAKGKSINII